MMKCIVNVGNPFKRFFNRVCFLHSFMHTSLSFSCVVQSSEEDKTHELDDYVLLKSRMEQYASSGCVANAVESLCAMRIFEGKPSVKEYNRLFYCYFGSGNVASEAVFELYKAMKSFGPCPNASTFNTLLYGMISCGDFRNGIVIAEDMCSSGFRPFSHFMSRLLKKSLESGGLYYSLCVLEFMLRFEYIPCPSAANMLIKRLCNVGMIRETHVLFCVLLEKSNNYFHGGYGYTHNKILWALCKSGQMYNVLAFFCYLRKKGIVYNVYSYTALVYGFCREKRWDDAFYCLSVMEIDGCRPNVITYTVILKYLCDAGKIQEALGLLEKMEKEGCIPDLVTLNIVLRELCLRNMTVEMGKLLGLMRRRGFSPDAFTYAALAGGFLKRGKVEAAKIFLLDRDCIVDAAVCNIYFHALCCERKSEEALSLVNSMMEMGIEPNNISYNTILKGICKEKNLDEALKFFDHIRWGTNTPDLVSFNTVLSAACKEGNWLVIRRILYQMGSEGFQLNVVSATCLIHYFCKIGEIPKCVKLLKSMMAIDMYREILKPDAVTWKSFMYELCKECKISVALQLLGQMRENGIIPDIGIYNTIFKALLKRGSFWDIVTLFKEMAQDRCEADEDSFALFDRAMSESWLKDFPRAGKQLKALLVGTSRVKIAS